MNNWALFGGTCRLSVLQLVRGLHRRTGVLATTIGITFHFRSVIMSDDVPRFQTFYKERKPTMDPSHSTFASPGPFSIRTRYEA
jgi:hypothetical protein